MANKKISELTSITGANVALGDLLEIVDITATDSEANKKITITELISYLGIVHTEGTWTPSESVGGVTISSVSGKYVRVGATVYCWCQFTVDAGGATVVIIEGMPFTQDDGYGSASGVLIEESGNTQYTVSSATTTSVQSPVLWSAVVGVVCNMSFTYLSDQFV